MKKVNLPPGVIGVRTTTCKHCIKEDRAGHCVLEDPRAFKTDKGQYLLISGKCSHTGKALRKLVKIDDAQKTFVYST